MKFKISFCFFLLCACAYTLIDTYVLVEILKISAFAEYSLQFTATIIQHTFLLHISIIFGKNI